MFCLFAEVNRDPCEYVPVLQPPVLASYEAHLPSVPQGQYSQLRNLLLFTLSQESKRRVEIARPRRQRVPQPAWDLETGARVRGGQDSRRKTMRKPVLDHKEEEGCRRICVISSGKLLIICGTPNDELALTCGSAVRTK